MLKPLVTTILACASLALASCTHTPYAVAETPDQRLEHLVAGPGGPERALAGVALVVMRGDKVLYAGAAGRAHIAPGAERPMTPDTKVRVASISKMALALIAQDLATHGALDMDRDVSAYLGWPLRNPGAPDKAITFRHLLAHTSTIRDPDAYWLPLGDEIHSFFLGNTPAFSVDHTAPGEWFEYTNLNYGVAASVLEAATGERFDHLASRYFKAQSLDIGYNWSGVRPSARIAGGTLYAHADGAWVAEVDDTPALEASAPLFLNPQNGDIAAYIPGTNGTLFSPQGGLRASAADLARLVPRLKAAPNVPLWTSPWQYDLAHPNGVTAEGGPKAYDFLTTYGLGVQILDGEQASPAWPGETLLGHPGEAYGLLSGAWVSLSRDVSFAYVITGVNEANEPPRGARTAFSVYEETLIDLAHEIASQP